MKGFGWEPTQYFLIVKIAQAEYSMEFYWTERFTDLTQTAMVDLIYYFMVAKQLHFGASFMFKNINKER